MQTLCSNSDSIHHRIAAVGICVGIQNYFLFLVICILGGSLAGCGSEHTHMVRGHITTSDGLPLAESRLVFRSDSGAISSAMTDADGFYEFGTRKSGDGIVAGRYAIVVLENRGDTDHPSPQRIHAKYSSANRSGLTFVVPDDGSRFDVTLDPPPHWTK